MWFWSKYLPPAWNIYCRKGRLLYEHDRVWKVFHEQSGYCYMKTIFVVQDKQTKSRKHDAVTLLPIVIILCVWKLMPKFMLHYSCSSRVDTAPPSLPKIVSVDVIVELIQLSNQRLTSVVPVMCVVECACMLSVHVCCMRMYVGVSDNFSGWASTHKSVCMRDREKERGGKKRKREGERKSTQWVKH